MHTYKTIILGVFMSILICQICSKECKNLMRHIQQHGISKKDYYDKYLKKPKEGICKRCGKETKWNDRKTIYTIYCSKACGIASRNEIYWQNPENKQKQKEFFKTKEYINKHKEGLKNYHSNPENKKAFSQSLKNSWKDEGRKEEIKERMIKRHKDNPEIGKKLSIDTSKRNRENWKKPEYRERMTKIFNETQAKLKSDPGYVKNQKERASRHMKNFWENENFKEEREKRLKNYYKGIKNYWDKDDSIEKASLKAVSQNKDPKNKFGNRMLRKDYIYKNIQMKSIYEIVFAKLCNKNKIEWLYEPRTFQINLSYRKRYTPDFYLTELDLWIEIKLKTYKTKKILELKHKFKEITNNDLIVIPSNRITNFFEHLIG